MLDFLPKRSTITGVYYANLIDQLRATIRENAEVNSLKVFCCNRTARESTLFFWLVVFLLCLLCVFVLYVF